MYPLATAKLAPPWESPQCLIYRGGIAAAVNGKDLVQWHILVF